MLSIALRHATDRAMDAKVPDEAADDSRKRRRLRDEIELLLRAKAREVFAEFGFQGATTREIAQRSGVSETLLFRYFGSKESIFDAVVSEPFQRLMRDCSHNIAAQDFTAANNDRFVADVFALASENRDVLKAYLMRTMTPNGDKPVSAAFDSYFTEARVQLDLQYARLGVRPSLDLDIAIRLDFAMIIIAVIGYPYLFHGTDAQPEDIKHALQAMIYRSLAPNGS